MMQEPIAEPSEPASPSTTHLVHALVQFALAVRHRKNVVILTLAVSGLLGGLYYATAIRLYAARAQLMVMQSSSAEMLSTSLTPQSDRQQTLMPTYESLICSAKVIEGALARLRPEDRIDLQDVPRDHWVRVLQRNVSAQTLRNTNIIVIEYQSKDPSAAVAVVNAVVQSYIEFMDKTHKGTAVAIMDMLGKEREQIEAKLTMKEGELQMVRSQVGGLYPQQGSHIVHPLVQRALSINEALIAAQKDRCEIQASLAVIEAAVRNGDDLQQPILSVANAVGKEMLLTSLGISAQDISSQTQVEREILADKADLATYEEHLGPQHPQVIALAGKVKVAQQYLLGYQDRIRQRIAELQTSRVGPMLLDMLRQRLNEVRQHEAILEQSYQQAMAEAAGLNGQLAQVEILEHDVNWLRDLHDVLLKRITDLDIKHEGPEIRTALIDEPVRCGVPVSPRLTRVALVVLVTGLGVGLIGVYVLDTLDDRFRSVEEMQQQLGVSVLAMVRPLPPNDLTGVESLQLYSHPEAPESEAFRTLRTALSLCDAQPTRLVITSAEPGDGKTTILTNLALSFAQAEKKTLLIDADLRRPGLSTMLGLRGTEGLSSVIRGQGTVVELAAVHIRASGVESLDILPAGTRPSDPAELLAHPRFAELLSWAETVYDQILIDSPPALAASDTAVVGRLCDGAVLVVQPEKNRRRLVMRAAESLTVVKIPLLGTVINRIGGQTGGGYYGYGDGYHYNYHYGANDSQPDAVADDALPTQQDTAVKPAPMEDGPPSETIVPRRVA